MSIFDPDTRALEIRVKTLENVIEKLLVVVDNLLARIKELED